MVFMPFIKPRHQLVPYVNNYLLFHVNLRHALPGQLIKPVPPDATQSLFFYPRSEVKTIVNGTGETRTAPPSIFVGNQTSRVNIEFGIDHLIIQVCFRPGFLFHLLDRMPISQFQHKEISAEFLSPPEMKNLNQRLAESTDYRQMIVLIEEYLLARIASLKINARPIDKAIVFLKESKAPVPLDWLASEACLSPRQFERAFFERLGMSPKFFARINRFDHAFKMKAAQPHLNWLAIAEECNYYDLSHLMRDFKQFGEVTPSLLMAQEKASPDRLFTA
jgi:AraC-like DNA-binding protein